MHRRSLTCSLAALAMAAFLPALACGQDGAKEGEWVSIFDGKSAEGWTLMPLGGQEGKTKFEVVDGVLVGTGGASMLYSPEGDYQNFKLRAEIMINDKGNSGLYFRAAKEPSFSSGIEAQIDATHADPIRTGSLYGMCHVYAPLTKPDTWFTYELEVVDREWRGRPVTGIKVSIDGNELYEFLDFDQKFKKGHFAFQQHDPGSTVKIRKVEVMRLPAGK